MEDEKKEVNLIVAGLKFSKTDIGVAASNEKNTLLAVLLITFTVIFGVVVAYFKGNGGSSGVGRMGLTGFEAAIAEMGSLLIGTFLSALIMVFVIRFFKVKPSYGDIIRVYGAAVIWSILVDIVGLFLPPALAMAGILFWLAYNFAVMFGLSGLTKIKIWQSFLTIVLTFAVVFGVMMLFGMIIGSVFG